MTSVLAQSWLDGESLTIPLPAHHAIGAISLVLLLVATALVGARAANADYVDGWTMFWVGLAQISVAANIVIGLLLLNDGRTLDQLVPHMLLGLAPLMLFVVFGWRATRKSVGSSRYLFLIMVLSLVTTGLSFAIGEGIKIF
ncbi:MAG: hypothetical protein KDB86_05440 [Actinobacteria bacterium]|nr:hypothetical protein [Actinomycetota bacterium]